MLLNDFYKQIIMNVNFEFLGSEPLDNVITFLNYKIDRAVFFGYQDVVNEQKTRTENFLKKYCGVQEVQFNILAQKDLNSVLRTLKKRINAELAAENRIYVDLTDGESLILIAFGMLDAEYRLPMHLYNIEKNELTELRGDRSLSKNVPERRVRLTCERYIELYGGKINDALHKDSKGAQNPGNRDLLNRVWELAAHYSRVWNPFVNLCHTYFLPDDDLSVCASAKSVRSALAKGNSALITEENLRKILKKLKEAEAITDLDCDENFYTFRYANETIKNYLWEGGSLLEQHVFQKYREGSDDCRVGVHIDWDGVIHPNAYNDVLNEIDVLVLRENIPTFISCKSGNMRPEQTLHALYELQTVADRFGGQYAKKILYTMQPLPGRIYYERAGEMGIEVEVVSS